MSRSVRLALRRGAPRARILRAVNPALADPPVEATAALRTLPCLAALRDAAVGARAPLLVDPTLGLAPLTGAPLASGGRRNQLLVRAVGLAGFGGLGGVCGLGGLAHDASAG
jgi:hypothetical protein